MSGIERIMDRIRPNATVFIAGSAGEPSALLAAWSADADRTAGLSIVSSAVPGINRLPVDDWSTSARVTGLFMQPSLARAQREGRFRHLPVSYAAFAARLAANALSIDTCVVQVAQADASGRHSLGLAGEFMPLVLAQARTVLGIVNHAMPAIADAPTIHPSRFDAVVEVACPLPEYDAGGDDGVADRIARTVAEWIGDGAAVQIGIGRVPAALAHRLRDRRGLRMQSGMLGDGARDLFEAGALDPTWRHQGCVAVGSRAFYDWLAVSAGFAIAGCEETHDLGRLSAIDGLVAINTALEVDLFGQCNLEVANGRPISGVGGAPDFARAATLSRGGLSIVALPAAAKGQTSRIVARLSPPGLVSLARTDVDIVVTEYGAADLRGRSTMERADALVAIAAPAFQDELARRWSEMLC